MILVTDAQLRHSLAVIRSLGRKGISVLAIPIMILSPGMIKNLS